MNDTLVIYHKADFDGIFCREIAKKAFGDTADYIGWDYGDPRPPAASNITRIYMLDISVDGMMDDPRLIWIDHHKSAMEKYYSTPRRMGGYCLDGVAACRLAWQWFFGGKGEGEHLPIKPDYIDRIVTEPLAVRLAGEYDIWDKRDPRAELFQHGLRSRELDELWPKLLRTKTPIAEAETGFSEDQLHDLIEADGTMTPPVVVRLLDAGRALQYAKTHENAGIITSYGFTVKFQGLTFLACNHARFNSHLFTAGIRWEHDALLGFNYDGAGMWRVSLYHAPGHEQHDLSEIAVKYGGGGHRGACGFKVKELPFLI